MTKKKFKRPPVSRMTHDYINIPGSPAPIALPKSYPGGLSNNIAKMIHQFFAVPQGHSVIQASDKSIHHVPTRNLAKAKSIDPGLSVLHSSPDAGMPQGAPQGVTPQAGGQGPVGPVGPAGMLPQIIAQAKAKQGA